MQANNGTAISSQHGFSQSAPATTQSSPTSAEAPQKNTNGGCSNGEGGPTLSVDTSFYHGTPTSSNPQTLYIQIATGTSGGAENSDAGNTSIGSSNSSTNDIWVSCPWQSTIKQMVEHPNLIYTLLNQLKIHPTMKNNALKILNGELNGSNINDHNGLGIGDFNLPPSPTMTAANTQNLSLFSPHGNDSPSLWGANYESGQAPHFRTGHVSCLPLFLPSLPLSFIKSRSFPSFYPFFLTPL